MTPNRFTPNHQLLPDDPVLEIVARCGTIGDAIRCAAASKSLRRRILDAPFLRHLRGFQLINNGGEHDDGGGRPFFIPTLLLGLYHQSGDPGLQLSFVPASDGATATNHPSLALPPPIGDDGACEFGPYLPVASRRSLLVLRRRCKTKEHLTERHGPHSVELSVYNPDTGERLVLPPHQLQNMSHALLDVDMFVAPSSFKLLVAELSFDNPSTLHVQIFSSDSEQGRGGWGPALACPITSRFGEPLSLNVGYGITRRSPVVLGDTVCWLCKTSQGGDRILAWRWRGGVAGAACVDYIPPGYSLGHTEMCLAVLPSPVDAAGSHAMLGLIVIDPGEIYVWACEKRGGGSARNWKLRHLIRKVAIPRPMGANQLRGELLRGCSPQLLWFCQGSGALFFRVRFGPASGLLLSLDLSPVLISQDTMEVSKLDAKEWELNPESNFCPYEVDLLSHMLIAMKQL